MTNTKKPTQDSERYLRRANEDLSSYDNAYAKFNKGGSSAQRDKLEAELRREIKKLYRSYDALSSLAASPDAKEAKAIDAYLRSFEERFESFKACEQLMKTRGSAKEGLSPSSPTESQHERVRDIEAWLKGTADSLQKLAQTTESDAERGGRGNHGRNKGGAASAASNRAQRLRFHATNLELILKRLANGEVDPENVDEIKERVEAIRRGEGNGSEDSEYNDDEALYAPFGLDERLVSERRRGGGLGDDDDASPPHPHNSNNKTSPINAAGAKANPSSPNMNVNAAMESRRGHGSGAAVRAEGTRRLGSASPSPNKGSASVTLALGGREGPHDNWEDEADLPDDDMDELNDDTFGDDAMAMAGSGSLAEMAKATGPVSRLGDWEKGRPANLTTPPSSAVKKLSAEPSAAATAAPHTAGDVAFPPAKGHNREPGVEQRHPTGASATHASATSASQAAAVSIDKEMMLRLVDMSLANVPHTQDVDRQRPFEPSNPTVHVPFFPQQVLPALASPDIYRTFELETLFFIFYYHQNTYQQYCAAGQIKDRSFRYHTELNTWFKRNGAPRESLEGSERGSFQFFDFEDSWQLEDKNDFVFDYKYLENELR